MPLIYGEGENAFRRLQEEIIKRSNDMSIFIFSAGVDEDSHLFTKSPKQFKPMYDPYLMKLDLGFPLVEFTLTNRGLHIKGVSLICMEEELTMKDYVWSRIYALTLPRTVTMPLRKIAPHTLVRHPKLQPSYLCWRTEERKDLLEEGQTDVHIITEPQLDEIGLGIKLRLVGDKTCAVLKVTPSLSYDYETGLVIFGAKQSSFFHDANMFAYKLMVHGNLLILVYRNIRVNYKDRSGLYPELYLRFLLFEHDQEWDQYMAFNEKSGYPINEATLRKWMHHTQGHQRRCRWQNDLGYDSELADGNPTGTIQQCLLDSLYSSSIRDFSLHSGSWRVSHRPVPVETYYRQNFEVSVEKVNT